MSYVNRDGDLTVEGYYNSFGDSVTLYLSIDEIVECYQKADYNISISKSIYTTNLPTEEGAYWVKLPTCDTPKLVNLHRAKGNQLFTDDGRCINHWDVFPYTPTKWHGPIVPPR